MNTPEEQLMAWFDGELSPQEQEQVKHWLEQHPEAEQQLEEYHQLQDIWDANPINDPSPKSWDRVWHNVESAIEEKHRPDHPNKKDYSGWMILGALTTVAASVLIMLNLNQTSRQGIVQNSPEPFIMASFDDVTIDAMNPEDASAIVTGQMPEGTIHDLTELVIATADEIEINSIDDYDMNSLVVGTPPIEGPLVLASEQDVNLDHVEPYDDGMMSNVYVSNEGTPMMIVARKGK